MQTHLYRKVTTSDFSPKSALWGVSFCLFLHVLLFHFWYQQNESYLPPRKIQTLWEMVYDPVTWAMHVLNAYIRDLKTHFLYETPYFLGFIFAKGTEKFSSYQTSYCSVLSQFLLFCSWNHHGSTLDMNKTKPKSSTHKNTSASTLLVLYIITLYKVHMWVKIN
jgi:hypothetical protein